MHCPWCNGKNFEQLYEAVNIFPSVARLPAACNEPQPTSAAISLVQCKKCGFIFNEHFNQSLMKQEYTDNNYYIKHAVSASMSSSERKVMDILLPFCTGDAVYCEIGSGSGGVAESMLPHVGTVYTVDPAVRSAQCGSQQEREARIHINDFFSYNTVKDRMPLADIIVARHLLEHLPLPADFIRDVLRCLRPGGHLYLETPNVDEILASARFFDIFHDHFGYYSLPLLMNRLGALNLEVSQTYEYFNGQIIGILLKKTEHPVSACHELPVIRYDGPSVRSRFARRLDAINTRLASAVNVAIYGAGAHANCLINHVDTTRITRCLDLDEYKQNRFLAGTSIMVCDPRQCVLAAFDKILIAASLHEKEIVEFLLKKGYEGEIVKTAFPE